MKKNYLEPKVSVVDVSTMRMFAGSNGTNSYTPTYTPVSVDTDEGYTMSGANSL